MTKPIRCKDCLYWREISEDTLGKWGACELSPCVWVPESDIQHGGWKQPAMYAHEGCKQGEPKIDHEFDKRFIANLKYIYVGGVTQISDNDTSKYLLERDLIRRVSTNFYCITNKGKEALINFIREDTECSDT